ncbi:hypothetical protein EAG_13331 [Camponotus floridanus]|uniref:Uncharacterized protein n=1 Tax=Camponotus floridanus TaxID=104421 RepID=E2A5M8_CAMFO|nr:uncharacterized protein LOC105248731 [Camponotus floridanus]EFN71225.1 hypothetical protein EAG_13331 [Camponotus floridanus]
MLDDQYCHTLDQRSESRKNVLSNSIMVTHTCVTGIADLPTDESIEEIAESVDELREKLANMKKLMEERKGTTLGEISARKRKETSDIIDGNFLSWIFGSVLLVILSVSFYAFYNLYHAVLKKFPSHHTEL